MDWIKWDHTLVLGHDAMDAEHRQLVALVNQLANCIVTDVGKEAYDALFDDLLSQTGAHFGTEERLMAACSYPYTKEHHAEHVKLIKDALDYRARFSGSARPSISPLFFFDNWLSRHIHTFDRELANFLAGINR